MQVIINNLIDQFFNKFSYGEIDTMAMREFIIDRFWENLCILYKTQEGDKSHIKISIHATSKGKVEIKPANMFTACALFMHYLPAARITNERCMQFSDGRIDCAEGQLYSFNTNHEIKINMQL